MFTDAIAACEGKTYESSGKEETFDKATWSAGMGILLDDGPCKGAAVEAALASGVSCSESLTLYASATVFSCQEDSAEPSAACPALCKSIMDQAFSECKSTDTIMSAGTELTAANVKMTADLLMQEKCKEYAATKTWKGEDGDDGDGGDGKGNASGAKSVAAVSGTFACLALLALRW